MLLLHQSSYFLPQPSKNEQNAESTRKPTTTKTPPLLKLEFKYFIQ